LDGMDSPLTQCQEQLQALLDQVNMLASRVENTERTMLPGRGNLSLPSPRSRWNDVVPRLSGALQRAGKVPIDLFKDCDLNQDGQLSRSDFERLLHTFQPDLMLSLSDIAIMMDRFDTNQHGFVSAHEFCREVSGCIANVVKDDSCSSNGARSNEQDRHEEPRCITVNDSFSVDEQFSRECSEAVEEQVAGVCEQVDELHSQVDQQLSLLHDRVSDLEARLQDTEGGLQDIQLDHDVRQETTHVSEQVLRLAMRMQRLECVGASGGMAADVEEVRQLRGELGDFSEQLLHLAGRLSNAERGLSGMAEAFGRVCEELAQLRGGRSPVRSSMDNSREQGPSRELSPDQEASQQLPDSASAANSPGPPLQHKVGEMERSLESMAEVVWELRKQVSSLRSNFVTLQSTVLGEEVVAAGAVQEE